MGGKITKTEKLLLACTAVYLAALCAVFAWERTSRGSGPEIRTDRIASSEEVIPLSARPVDINTASAEQLAQLPGIGPTLAGRIVAYRESHGAFRKLSELLQVTGIGPDTFLQMLDEITVGEETP